MKKQFIVVACFVFSASIATGQTQSGQTAPPGGTTQPGSPGQSGAAPVQPINPQVDAGGNRILQTQPAAPTFGGTNQVTFGTTNPPFARTNPGFAATNIPPRFGPNTPPSVAATGVINEASGAANPSAVGGTNAAALADQAFTQQLRAALARPGPTQIFFPQTRSTITVMNQGGVVTLQGMAANEGERRSIEARIKNTPGVTSVNNQLQIPSFVPGPLPGSETNRQLLNP